MARLMIHRDLLKVIPQLPAAVGKKISETIRKFHEDSTQASLHLEPLNGAVDSKVRSIRLSKEYRAIVIAPEKGDVFLLMHVDNHDEAYRWVKNKRFEMHSATSTIQVFDVEEVQGAIASEAVSHQAVKDDYPLVALNDEDLYECGVPRPLVPAVRAIRSDEAFEALSKYLPKEAAEILYGIACGMSKTESFQAVMGFDARSAAEQPEGPGDFSTVTQEAQMDLVFVDGEDDLQRAISASLEDWRIFLHPSQRRLVNWNVSGPMKVNGAAGTGKTVVLMHRAVRIARDLRDSTRDRPRILITTFTTNLSATISALVKRLDPEAAQRIEVTNLHALARTICTRSGWRGRIADDSEINEIWDQIFSEPGLEVGSFDQVFFQKEFRDIVDPMGIYSEDDYLTCVRSGRPRVSRKQRKEIWPVMVEFISALKKRNLLTFEGAVHQARLACEQGGFSEYAHVLVDEVQDFGLEALRLIRALSPKEEGSINPLCVVGDGHQRIYKYPVPLSRAGINVRGRSRRLKVNYRTSEQIRRYAQGLLEGMEIDDLDGASAVTVGDKSAFTGPEPSLFPCASEEEEAEGVVTWIRKLLDAGLESHEICVTPNREHVRGALETAGIPTLVLLKNQKDPEDKEQGVRLGSMARIKGLEFRAIAMATFKMHRPANESRERCLRYVAATRAQRFLLVTHGT